MNFKKCVETIAKNEGLSSQLEIKEGIPMKTEAIQGKSVICLAQSTPGSPHEYHEYGLS